MQHRSTLVLVLAAVALSATTALRAGDPKPDPRAGAPIFKAQVGDFDMMLERRTIRVLVPPSRTLYFNDKGRVRGLTAELVRDFEEYLNQKYRKKLRNRPITVILIPTSRDRLIPVSPRPTGARSNAPNTST